jgi:hypothetical protein
METATSKPPVIDLTRSRPSRRWAALSGAALLVLGAAAGFFWVLRWKAGEDRAKERVRGDARRTPLELGAFTFSLDLGPETRTQTQGTAVDVNFGSDQMQAVCRFELMVNGGAAPHATLAEASLARETQAGSEILVRRTRRLGPGGLALAREIVVRRTSGIVHHLLFVAVPDGVLRISYELGPLPALELEDRIESVIASLRWPAPD